MLQHPEKYAWIRHIKDLLCCHGFTSRYIWNDQAVANEKAFITFLSSELKTNSFRNASPIFKTATDASII